MPPLEEGLLPGEVILLDWANHKSETASIPAYFKYEYGLNAAKDRHNLIRLGYLTVASPSESLKSLRVPELKDILRENNQKVSGKKPDLIQRITDNIGESSYSTSFVNRSLICTPTGNSLLEKYSYLVWAHKNNSKDGIINVANALTTTKESLLAKHINSTRVDKATFTEDYFFRQGQTLSGLWSQKKLNQVESLGLRAIQEGNWYPVIFHTLAMLYRKQQRLEDEARILEIGIERTKRNPGVARKDFTKRLDRVNELIASSKS